MDRDIVRVMVVEIARGLAPERSSMAPLSDEGLVVWSPPQAPDAGDRRPGPDRGILADFPDVNDYEHGTARHLDGRGSSQ